MSHVNRMVILGSLVIGLTLTLAFALGTHHAPSAFGEASGYGSDTVPPRQLAVNPSSGHSSKTPLVVGGVAGVVLLGSTGGILFLRLHGHS